MKNTPSNYLNRNDSMIKKGKQIRMTEQRWNADLFPNQLQLFSILNENFFHGISAIICTQS